MHITINSPIKAVHWCNEGKHASLIFTSFKTFFWKINSRIREFSNKNPPEQSNTGRQRKTNQRLAERGRILRRCWELRVSNRWNMWPQSFQSSHCTSRKQTKQVKSQAWRGSQSINQAKNNRLDGDQRTIDQRYPILHLWSDDNCDILLSPQNLQSQ